MKSPVSLTSHIDHTKKNLRKKLFVDVNIFRLDLIEKGLYKILTEYPVGSQHLAAFLKMKMMRRGFVNPFLSSKFRQHNRTFYL